MKQVTAFEAEQPVGSFNAALALNTRIDGGAMRARELQLSRFRVQRASSRLKWTADRGIWDEAADGPCPAMGPRDGPAL
jgi:hypothetical protein